jgi:hypothetical protein
MQLTVAVVLLTTVLSLAISGRSTGGAACFFAVVLAHLAIHTGPRWLVFSSIARMLGAALTRLSRDPASSIQAMLAAGVVGWFIALALRGLFSDEPRGDWDPDQPRRLRRARRAA